MAGMTSFTSQTTFTLVTMTVTLTLLMTSHACETRCEQSVPGLVTLRSHWARSYKRIGERRISFEQFLLSLFQTSANMPEMRSLHLVLRSMLSQYQDCVMACEHQFSKRSGLASDEVRGLDEGRSQDDGRSEDEGRSQDDGRSPDDRLSILESICTLLLYQAERDEPPSSSLINRLCR